MMAVVAVAVGGGVVVRIVENGCRVAVRVGRKFDDSNVAYCIQYRALNSSVS